MAIRKTTKGKNANYRPTKSGAGMTAKGVARYRRANPGSKLKTAVIGILTGIVSYGGLYFYITAIKGGPGSVVITIFSLDMFFILLLSYLLFGERLNRNQIFGFLLSAIGLILIGLK